MERRSQIRRAQKSPARRSPHVDDGESLLLQWAWIRTVEKFESAQLQESGQDLKELHRRLFGAAARRHSELVAPARYPRLLTQLARAAKADLPPGEETSLDHRIALFGQMLDCDEIECAILAAMARFDLFENWKRLKAIITTHLLGLRFCADTLAGILEIPGHEVEHRLRDGAPLLRIGLLHKDDDGEIVTGDFLSRMARSTAATRADLASYLMPEPATSTLRWEDFDHLGAARDIAERLVRSGEGGPILLHGPAGTGKTEFAALLAARAGAGALFAGMMDGHGREPSRSERLSHFALLRALTRNDPTRIVVLDEAEDVLMLGLHRRGERSKQWLNRLIDECERPVIWIVNEPDLLEPSILRRMDHAIAFPQPPRRVRQRIVTRHAADHALELDEDAVTRIARMQAAPAVLGAAVRGAKRVGGGATEAMVIGEGLLTVLHGYAPPLIALPAAYDPALALADCDLDALAGRLAASDQRGWSLLLSGPSGTGKSAYARHLAERMGIELIERRGSDLLAKYLGETEAAIASAFAEAARAGAMLLIDEADDFLGDRQMASRSWERTMVNEMLRQMETLHAPFVATTNLADRLDPATRRRFTLQANLQTLDEERAARLFVRWFGHDLPAGQRLTGQTPGDFTLIAARARLLGETEPGVQLAWLKAEAAARAGQRGRLGF